MGSNLSPIQHENALLPLDNLDKQSMAKQPEVTANQ